MTGKTYPAHGVAAENTGTEIKRCTPTYCFC
jgi:hypothetical protein